MASKPDSMEALKIMTDYLHKAEGLQNRQEPAAYYGYAAICSGLAAVVYELRTLKEALARAPA